MKFRQSYSDELCARVRTHFALSQTELADFVGISRALLANVEAGRRTLPDPARRRLFVLLRWLPAPLGEGPAAPEDATAPAHPDAPDQAELRYRRLYVHAQIAKIELALLGRGRRQHTYQRRHWALQVLREGLATTAPPADAALRKLWEAAAPDAAADLRWLRQLAREAANAPEPLTATERALRTARLRGLEAERAALDELLAERSPAQ